MPAPALPHLAPRQLAASATILLRALLATYSLEVGEEHVEVSVQLDEPLVDVLDFLCCSLGLALLEAGGVLQLGQVVQNPG